MLKKDWARDQRECAEVSELRAAELVAWKRDAVRVSLRSTWPLPILVVVADDFPGTDVFRLSCIVHTVDVRLELELSVEAWQDYPRSDVMFSVQVPQRASSADRLARILALVRQTLLHELDEALLVDGSPARDPHGDESTDGLTGDLRAA